MTPKRYDVTALIPIHRTKGNREWLQQAVNSLNGCEILVLENDSPQEMCAALNYGLRSVETTFYIAFGSDDIAGADMVDYMLGPAWNADVVYPEMLIASEDLSEFYGVHPADPFCGNRLLDMNYVTGASLLRTEKVREVGGYNEDLDTLEDWDLMVRLHRAGARFKPCPEAKLIYRQVAGSRNKTKGDRTIEDMRKLIVGDEQPLRDMKATFYHQATPATTYLRCQLPARYLPGVVRNNPVIAFGEEETVFPEHHGTAVFQFAADKTTAAIQEHMRLNGIRVLIEVDDNYLIDPGRQILKNQGWGLQIGESPFTREGHRLLASKADGIIVTTPHLAEQYAAVNDNIFVCPNTVDPVDWPEPVERDDDVVRIAWFASKSHAGDAPLIRDAFKWASEQPNVEVYVAGLNPKETKAGALRWNFKFGYLPWIHDLDQYRHMFKDFDIGVAPVKPSGMGLGRSDVKALEMGMGSQAPILSNVAPYDDWIDNYNCLKADGPDGFLEAIQELVGDPEMRRAIAGNARKYALTERTTEKQIGCWEAACQGSVPACPVR